MGVKSRILSDCLGYKPNQVVDFQTPLAKTLADAGLIDSNKAAVNYCLNELAASVVVHADDHGANKSTEGKP